MRVMTQVERFIEENVTALLVAVFDNDEDKTNNDEDSVPHVDSGEFIISKM